MLSFPRFMAPIFELSFVGKDFENLLRRLLRNKFFAGVSDSPKVCERVMTMYSEKIRSAMIFHGKFPNGFDNATFFVSRSKLI